MTPPKFANIGYCSGREHQFKTLLTIDRMDDSVTPDTFRLVCAEVARFMENKYKQQMKIQECVE